MNEERIDMAKKTNTPSRKKKRIGRKSKYSFQTLLILAIVIGCVKMCRGLNNNDNAGDKGITTASIGEYGDLMAVATKPGTQEVNKKYKGMDISFNPKFHIPNWVSWELTADETTGEVTRSNKFNNDESVVGCADSWDYNYSGYDRGHMAPAGDMKWDKGAMEETFFMTNICPQVKSLNTGSWKRLEEKCRYWAQVKGCLYVVCGPIIDGEPIEYIGDSKVYVPKKFFKVILAPYSEPAVGIGFIMPNGKVEGGMQECAVPIDSVESVTGHDFFASLPDEIENDVESQCNFHYWSTLRKSK